VIVSAAETVIPSRHPASGTATRMIAAGTTKAVRARVKVRTA